MLRCRRRASALMPLVIPAGSSMLLMAASHRLHAASPAQQPILFCMEESAVGTSMIPAPYDVPRIWAMTGQAFSTTCCPLHVLHHETCQHHLLLISLLSASSSTEFTDLVRSASGLAPGCFSCRVFQYCSHCNIFHLGASCRPSAPEIWPYIGPQPLFSRAKGMSCFCQTRRATCMMAPHTWLNGARVQMTASAALCVCI